jgi:hypothetical protein
VFANNHSVLRVRAARGIAALAVAGLGVVGVTGPAPAADLPRSRAAVTAEGGTAADDGSQTPEERALAEAAATGQPVEVVERRTELSETWAEPAGDFTEKRYGSPIRVRRGGAWVPVDPTLQRRTDGRVAPVATAVSMSFSGGGTDALVTSAKDGRTLSLTWPRPLPAPTLAGSIASYPEVLPGVDLQLKAGVEGFSQLLVVKTAAAAQHPDLVKLRYGIDSVGLAVSADEDGNLSAVNPAGQLAFTSPAPLMWDSSTDPGQPPAAARSGAEAAASGDGFEPPPGANDAVMDAAVVGDTLELTPDAALLNAPTTKYPVYLDPSWAEGKRQNWTRIYKKYPRNSYWNANEVARVGYENETNGLSRSFFQLRTGFTAGQAETVRISKSTFRIKNVWSWSCQNRPVQLWQTTGISKRTTWNNQPGKVGSAPLRVVDDAKGWSSSCPAGNLEFDITAKMRAVVAGGAPSVTLGMYAANESDTFGWKKFDAKTAVLETRYNTVPNMPTRLGTHPRTSCPGGAVGNATISLYATIADADAGNLTAEFEVSPVGQNPNVNMSVSALNRRVSTLVVPDAKLPTGSYQWRVRAKDRDGAYSPWSGTCKFSVDRTRPSNPPKISSPQFPNGDSGWPATTGRARTPGTFTMEANGVADVAQYVYYSDWDPDTRMVSAASPGGPQSVTLTPPGFGPHYVYAYSVDAAGNRSDTATYLFYATRSTEQDAPGDLNGDGHGDIWTIDTAGNLLTYAGQGGGRFSAAGNGGLNLGGAQITYRGDWHKDGYTDLVVRERDGGADRYKINVYPNNGAGAAATRDQSPGVQELTLGCPVARPEDGCAAGNDHWQNAQQIVAPGDVNGDGAPDLLVKEGTLLWLYYGTHTMILDELGDPVLVGDNNWDKVTVAAPGDTNGDGLPDLWTRDLATGKVHQRLGQKGPDGAFDPASWGTVTPLQIGSGLTPAAYPTVASGGDLTGDGKPDLWAHLPNNILLAWAGRVPSSGTYAFDAPQTVDGITGTKLTPGTRLNPGAAITSGSVRLAMQSGGNLVVTGADQRVLWASNTDGNSGAYAVMKSDGALVVNSAADAPLWSSRTGGNANAYAVLQENGNLVVCTAGGLALWSSNTTVRRDHNRDGNADIVAKWNTDGSLHLYPGDGNGHLGNHRQIWDTSWNSVGEMVSGDFTSDGKTDIVAKWNNDGSLHLYPGDGTGRLGGHLPVWDTSWKGVGQMVSGDYNSDGKTDVLAKWSDGSLHLYPGDGNGHLGGHVPVWDTGWRGVVEMASGDYNSDGKTDVLGKWSDGSLHLYAGDGRGRLAGHLQIWDTGWKGVGVLASGDYTGDGRTDVIGKWNSDGSLHLYPGDGNGRLGGHTQIWDSSWRFVGEMT